MIHQKVCEGMPFFCFFKYETLVEGDCELSERDGE